MTLAPAPPDTPAHEATRTAPRRQTIALVGNPNAGKTTLFNALTGLRAKTANFPGTTIELRVGALRLAGESVRLIDMPGLYSLSAASSEERAALDGLLGLAPEHPAPTALILLLDSTNLERNLFLASQVLELGLPTVIALNMVDLAQRLGLRIKVAELRASWAARWFRSSPRPAAASMSCAPNWSGSSRGAPMCRTSRPPSGRASSIRSRSTSAMTGPSASSAAASFIQTARFTAAARRSTAS